MKLNELKAPLTAQALNETLAKTFGKKHNKFQIGVA